MSAIVFLRDGRFDLQSTLWLQASGVVGVLLVAPFVAYLKAEVLRVLLLFVLIFNVYKLYHSMQEGSPPTSTKDDDDFDIELRESAE